MCRSLTFLDTSNHTERFQWIKFFLSSRSVLVSVKQLPGKVILRATVLIDCVHSRIVFRCLNCRHHLCLHILMSIEAPETSDVSFNSVWRQLCFCSSLRSTCRGALFQRHTHGLRLTLVVQLRRCPASSPSIAASCPAASEDSTGSLSLTSGPLGTALAARATSASASSLVQIASNRARHSDECDPVHHEHLVQSGVRPCLSNI